MPAQVIDIPSAIHTKTVVVPNYYVFGIEFLNEKPLDILIGTLLGELYGERNNYQVINTVPFEQLYFFLRSGNQL